MEISAVRVISSAGLPCHPCAMIRRALPPSNPNRLVLLALLAFSAVLVSAAPQQWPEAHPPVGQQPRRPAGYVPYTYQRTPEELWHTETAALLERSAKARRDIEQTIGHGPYRATFESISTHQAPEWFLDAKFGMFVDWGPWSVAGWAPQAEKATYPDWYEQKLFKEYRDYHDKTWGADIGPDDLIQLLDGGNFDPHALASLAKAAGMRYVVPFLKHHGGYCLWDSSFTHRDAMEWGLKRDLASELAARSATRACAPAPMSHSANGRTRSSATTRCGRCPSTALRRRR